MAPGAADEPRHDLVEAARRGDAEAFGRLVQPHLAALYRTACGVLLDRDLAQDAVQEALVRAYLALRRYDPSRPLRPWLYRLVLNEARRLRRRQARNPLPLAPAEILPDDQADAPEAAVLERERRELLWQALAGLSELHRAVIILHYYEQMSTREIAGVLGIRPGTVASRLHHARRRLHQLLEREPAGGAMPLSGSSNPWVVSAEVGRDAGS